MKRLLLTLIATIWIFSVHALRYELTSQRITTADGLPTNIVSRIWQTDDGYMWFETRSGICRYDGYEVRLFPHGTTAVPGRKKELRVADAVWQREGYGRVTRHGKDGSVRSWQLISHDIISYTKNDHFHVADVDECTEAISTYGNGLFLYDKPTGELTQIEGGVIDNPYLTGLFVDKTGAIWIIEDYLGVKCLRLNRLNYKRKQLIHGANIQDVNHVRSISELHNGMLLIGNQTGDVYRYDTHSDKSYFQKNMGSRVYASLFDSKGRLWIGTRGKGLFCEGKYIEGLPSADIFSLAEDPREGIWVAMLHGGVVHLHPDGKMDSWLKGKDCHDIKPDDGGRWWVAAEDSLYIINVGTGAVGIRAGYFVCLSPGVEGTMWAGSIADGLINAKTGQSYTTANGLVNNNVYSIINDNRGSLWIGTEEGLSCLNTMTGHIHNYRFSESLLSNVFSEQTACRLNDGRLLFGTHEGFIEVLPEDNPASPAPPRTTITRLLAGGILKADSMLQFTHCRLAYNENNVTISYSNFQYAKLYDVLYQYKLEGADDEWASPTKEHSVTYRHLSPGTYRFRVRAGSGNGRWGEEAMMDITIDEPWWNTWWAWAAYLLAFAVLCLMAVRIFRLRQHLLLERRVSAFKTDFYDRIERELRNPVNVLQGAAENVQVAGTSKTTVQSLRRGSRRMLRLLDMIRQLHSLDNNELNMKALDDQGSSEAEERFRNIVENIHAEEEEFKELAPPPVNNLTVVIVEDDEDSLTHLTDVLNPLFSIVGCTDLTECQRLVSVHQPSLLIIDITHCEREGRKLTRKLHGDYPSLPIIHLSSFIDDNHQLLSLRSGAHDYLVKPFSGKVLIERIRKANVFLSPNANSDQRDGIPNRSAGNIANNQQLLTSVKDKRFIELFNALLSKHAGDPDISVERLAEMMGLGRVQFYKRVKALTGDTPVQHLQKARLNYVARLLQQEPGVNVEELMLRVGFHNATHFYNAFKKQFGMSPKEMRNATASIPLQQVAEITVNENDL